MVSTTSWSRCTPALLLGLLAPENCQPKQLPVLSREWPTAAAKTAACCRRRTAKCRLIRWRYDTRVIVRCVDRKVTRKRIVPGDVLWRCRRLAAYERLFARAQSFLRSVGLRHKLRGRANSGRPADRTSVTCADRGFVRFEDQRAGHITAAA